MLIYHARVANAFARLVQIGFGQHIIAAVFLVHQAGQFILIDAIFTRLQQTLGVAHNPSVNQPVDI